MNKQQLIKELSQYPDDTEIQVFNDVSGNYHNITSVEPHAMKDESLVICFEEDES